MMTSWILLAIGATLIWTLVNLIDKLVVDHLVKNYKFASYVSGITMSILFIAISLLNGKIITNINVVILGLLAGILYPISCWVYYEILGKEEMSRYIPMLATSTALVAVFAFFLAGERLTTQGYFGIILITLGTIIISLRKTNYKIKISTTFILTIFSVLLVALKNVVIKVGTPAGSVVPVLFWIGIGTAFVSIVFVITNKQKITTSEKLGIKPLIFNAVISTLAYVMFITAIAYGPVSLVTAISATKHLMIFFMATGISLFHPYLLNEKMNKTILTQKSIAIGVIFLGSILII